MTSRKKSGLAARSSSNRKWLRFVSFLKRNLQPASNTEPRTRWTTVSQAARRSLCLSAAVASLSCFAATGLGQQVNWTGNGANDFWLDAANWDSGVPTNTSDVFIGSPSPTILNGNAIIQSLNIGSDGIVNTQSGTSLSFSGTAAAPMTNLGLFHLATNSNLKIYGAITNSGDLSANHSVNTGSSDIRIQASGANFDGGGTISLSGTGARLIADTTNTTISLNNQTVQGDGQVGANSLGLTINADGKIVANSSGKILVLDASSDGVTNAGLLQATNGGTLQIKDSHIQNGNGTIEAQAGSTVLLTNNASVDGGMLTGEGLFQIGGGQTASFSNLNNSSTISLVSGSVARVVGNLTNSGTYELNHLVNTSSPVFHVEAGGVVLDGGGSIVLNGTGNGSKISGDQDEILTLANQTISGQGQVGDNKIGLTIGSQGKVDANILGKLMVLNASDMGVTNVGTIQATNGGQLLITDTAVDNTGGQIIAASDSEVQFSANASVEGGVLQGEGTFTVLANNTASFANLTNQGHLQLVYGSTANLAGTIENQGTIDLNHLVNSNLSRLLLQDPTVTLSGGGTTTLGGTGNGAIITGNTGSVLNVANQTIQGQGQVGYNQIGVDIAAGSQINANVAGKTLTLDSGTPGVTNSGLLTASNGGRMLITDTAIDNSAGAIVAQSGSEIQFSNNASVQGGELSGPGTFTVLANNSASFSDVMLQSTLNLVHGSTANLAGTIENQGTIDLYHLVNSNLSRLLLQDPTVTLSGGGTTTLGGTGDGAIISGNTGSVLNVANQTIQGQGQVGYNQIGVNIAAGSQINANVAGKTLTLDSGTPGVTNSGLLTASNGGRMLITDTVVENSSGQIIANAGSQVQLKANATILGGELSGDGEFQVLANSSAYMSDVTNTSQINLAYGSQLGVSGTIANTGDIHLDHLTNTGQPTISIQSAGATFDGGGTITMAGTGGGARISGGNGGALTIGNQTIQGYGNVGANNLDLTNTANGTIQANVANRTLTIDPEGPATQTWGNLGTLKATNGGTLQVAHNLDNSGTLVVDDGGTLAAGDFIGGTLVNTGLMDVRDTGLIETYSLNNGGLLTGDGTISADLFINNGYINPGSSFGTLNVTAQQATLGSSGQFTVEIGGAGAGEYDALAIHLNNNFGKLALSGELLIDLQGYNPLGSDEFTILFADNNLATDGPDIEGFFTNVLDGGTLQTLGGEGFFTVSSYGGNSIRLSNFSAVPEPSSAMLVSLASGALLLRRRRRSRCN